LKFKRGSIAGAVAVVLGLVGCRDAAAPETRLVVAVALEAPPQALIENTVNGPLITCSVAVTVSAEGSGSATWTGATALWFWGPDRSIAVGTTAISVADVQGVFGGASIPAGETRRAYWILRNSVPFEVTLTFSYTLADGLTTGSASTHFICGPTPLGVVDPTITSPLRSPGFVTARPASARAH
jgi:hypothetical protein